MKNIKITKPQPIELLTTVSSEEREDRRDEGQDMRLYRGEGVRGSHQVAIEPMRL